MFVTTVNFLFLGRKTTLETCYSTTPRMGSSRKNCRKHHRTKHNFVNKVTLGCCQTCETTSREHYYVFILSVFMCKPVQTWVSCKIRDASLYLRKRILSLMLVPFFLLKNKSVFLRENWSYWAFKTAFGDFRGNVWTVFVISFFECS